MWTKQRMQELLRLCSHRCLFPVLMLFALAFGRNGAAQTSTPDRSQVLETMKRATTFMVEKVSIRGGYVWAYLPDLSRRWGEVEAWDTQIWVQPPGTSTMGHLFLDAYHATGDEYYYRAAKTAADALVAGQLPEGGWNYLIDFAGDRSLRRWYDTIGRNAWRLEEYQHYWGNSTFDDGGTVDSAELLLRLYLEKHESRYKNALEKAIRLVLNSQHTVGAWPQRWPARREFRTHGRPDYTSFLTFNDNVTAGNIEFLLRCYQTLGEKRFLDPIRRGMLAFPATQQASPQAGWALQYTLDLKPAGARSYEPAALATHTTAGNIEQLLKFYRLTGETKFLSRIPEALDWLDAVRLPSEAATLAYGRTHPTFVEIGTNKPLYLHRRGSNVVNGEYYVDGDPHNTLGHFGSFRQIDVNRLRKEYLEAKTLPVESATKGSPLLAGAVTHELPRYFLAVDPHLGLSGNPESVAERITRIIADLDAQGRWITALTSTSHPYRGNGSPTVTPGDFRQTLVGDERDTSPYRTARLNGISTRIFIRNMSELIRYLRGEPR